MGRKPKWLVLGEELIWPIVGMGLALLDKKWRTDSRRINEGEIPYTALLHFAHSLEISMSANKEGKHSVAISLLRHCVETLTLVDIGLQDASYSDPLLIAWRGGKKSLGELRASLEKNIWSRYSHGLWDEPWPEFFRNLAQAVQPYAHYTVELQQWQFAALTTEWLPSGEVEQLQVTGLYSYDALKASRITLLHTILGWALAHILLITGESEDIISRQQQIDTLGVQLAQSKLLFPREDWGVQLRGNMWFRPGVDWIDD